MIEISFAQYLEYFAFGFYYKVGKKYLISSKNNF